MRGLKAGMNLRRSGNLVTSEVIYDKENKGLISGLGGMIQIPSRRSIYYEMGFEKLGASFSPKFDYKRRISPSTEEEG